MRNDSSSWRSAKAHGDAGELQAIQLWDRAGFSATLKPGHNAFDVAVTATIEVKRDLHAAKTGYVAIEFARNGKQSGITTSVATLWHIDVGAEVFILPTAALRYLAEHGPYRHVRGGDGGQSGLILIPLADLRRSALLILPGRGTR